MDALEKREGSAAESETDVKVPCEVYSRIVGYLRPVQAWNEGKKQEFEDRQVFDVSQHSEEGGATG